MVAGLLKLNQDKGSLPLTEVLAPAIKAAEEGYAILPGVAYRQQMAVESNESRQNIQLRLVYSFGSKFGKNKGDRNRTQEEGRIRDEN